MKTKIFNLLAVLALTASSLAIHQSASADGAYRIGFNLLDNGSTYVLIGAAVGAMDSAAAQTAAQQACLDQQTAQDGTSSGGTNFPQCNVNPNTADETKFPATDVNFEDQCIVAVRVGGTGYFRLGIGVADNCEAARTEARADCNFCDNSTPETTLNDDDALYLIDGDMTRVCSDATHYDFSLDGRVSVATDGIDCRTPETNGECETINMATPILIDGNCAATCEDPDNEEANDADGVGCRSTIDCGDNSGLITGTTTCMCEENFAGADGMNCMACTVDNASPNENRTACECDSGFDGDGTTACTAIDCGDDSELQADGKTCMCDANHISPSGEGRDCIFDADSCGSNSSPQTDDDGNTMCVCAANYSGEDGRNCQLAEIPAAEGFTFDGETGIGKTAAAPIVVAFAQATSVAIAIMPTLTVDLTYTEIGDSELDVTPAGVVSFAPDITTVTAGMYSIFIAAAETGNTDNTVATISLYLSVSSAGGIGEIVSGRSSSSKIALGIASSAAVLMALYFISDVAYDNMHWTPSYAFTNNNGNVSYSVGSRWTATADNWRFYWQQRIGDGEFVYGSGMRYSGDIFAAAMNSESNTDKTDWDVALSASKSLGMWNLGGGYNFDIEVSDTETDTKNRLNLSADVAIDGWQLSAAATHESQNRLNVAARYTVDKWILSATANTDGKEAAARINYSYRF